MELSGFRAAVLAVFSWGLVALLSYTSYFIVLYGKVITVVQEHRLIPPTVRCAVSPSIPRSGSRASGVSVIRACVCVDVIVTASCGAGGLSQWCARCGVPTCLTYGPLAQVSVRVCNCGIGWPCLQLGLTLPSLIRAWDVSGRVRTTGRRLLL